MSTTPEYAATTRDNDRALRDFLTSPAAAHAERILAAAPLILRTDSVYRARDLAMKMRGDTTTIRRVQHRLNVLWQAYSGGVRDAFSGVVFRKGFAGDPDEYVDSRLVSYQSVPPNEYRAWLDENPELICRSIVNLFEKAAQQPADLDDRATASHSVGQVVRAYCLRRAFEVGVDRAITEFESADMELGADFVARPDPQPARDLLAVAEAAGDLITPDFRYAERIRHLLLHPELLEDTSQAIVLRILPPPADTTERTVADEAHSLWATTVRDGMQHGPLRALLTEILWTPSAERARELCYDFAEIIDEGPWPEVRLDPGMGADAAAQGAARLRLLEQARLDRQQHLRDLLQRLRQCVSWPEIRHLLHRHPVLTSAQAAEIVADGEPDDGRLDIAQLLQAVAEVGVDAAVERMRRQVSQQDLEQQTGRPVVSLSREHMESLGLGDEAEQLGHHKSVLARNFIAILLDEFRRTAAPGLLEDALLISDADLDWLRAGTADRGEALVARTRVLSYRWSLANDLADLDELILCTDQVIGCPVSERTALENLVQRADASFFRFELTDEHRDLTSAQDTLQECLERFATILRDDASAETGILVMLSRVKRAAYLRGGDVDQLAEATRILRHALTIDGVDQNDVRRVHQALAIISAHRAEATDDERALREAVQHMREARDLAEPGSIARRTATVDLAKLLLRDGPTDGTATWRSELIDALSAPGLPQHSHLSAYATLMESFAGEQDWEQAAHHAHRWWSEYARFSRSQVVGRFREAVIRSESTLVADAALYQARGGRVWEALITLEAGRMSMLVDQLGFHLPDDRADTAAIRRAVANVEQYDRLLRIDSADSPAYSEQPQRQAVLQEARRRHDAGVRLLSDGADPAERLRHRLAAAAETTPLVYLSAARRGGMALILRPGADPELRELPRLSRDAVSQMVTSLYRGNGAQSLVSALQRVTAQLWDDCIGPLAPHLPGERFLLVASGQTGLLPLHAAWTPDGSTLTGKRFALDILDFVYAVTTTASTGTGVTTGPDLLVDDPGVSGGERLVFARHEADAALAAGAGAKVLRGGDATVEHVAAAISTATWAHLSCHGEADLLDPRQSGILLADGRRLTVADLMTLNLARLSTVVISACESARSDLALPDEALGLPGALVAAGAEQVIGSMWRVPQLTTAEIMMRFYSEITSGTDVVTALRRAQIATRDTTTAEKEEFFTSRGLIYPGLSPAGDRPSARVFEWAGFGVFGRPANDQGPKVSRSAPAGDSDAVAGE